FSILPHVTITSNAAKEQRDASRKQCVNGIILPFRTVNILSFLFPPTDTTHATLLTKRPYHFPICSQPFQQSVAAFPQKGCNVLISHLRADFIFDFKRFALFL
ncbi:MAG TPA: hypothetical protein DDZ04_04830, partial [Parabacteroides sp.]|nr:hypothetical protein [Parabacteroides sp.]